MSERILKTAWHLLIAACALAESASARTNLRRMLLTATAGWHIGAAAIDWADLENGDEGWSK